MHIYALIRASYSDIHYQLIDNARKMKTLAALTRTILAFAEHRFLTYSFERAIKIVIPIHGAILR